MPRLLPIATASLIALGAMPLVAQQQTATAVNQVTNARAAATKAAIARAKEKSLTSIQGNALSSTNGQMNNMIVRLRDARFGRIVDSQLTDKSGMFAFKAIDPGNYIVEIMSSNDQTILAASQMLNVNAGEAVSAVVKMPFKIPPFAGIMGSTTTTPTATAVATEAAASSVAAVVPTIPISPNQ